MTIHFLNGLIRLDADFLTDIEQMQLFGNVVNLTGVVLFMAGTLIL